jgi:hypothetical protein
MNPRSPVAARLGVLAAIVSIAFTGCGSQPPTPIPSESATGSPASFVPVQVTNSVHLGDNRLVFGLVDPKGNKELSDPNRSLSIGYRGPGGQTIPAAAQTFVWAIENVRGVYIGHATFPVTGSWTADLTSQTPGGPPEQVAFSFEVIERSPVLGAGDPAPSVRTPTLDDVGGDVAKISSDPKPDLDFYKTSEASALAAKKPFVLIFATPKFCQTASCGPALDRLKPVAQAHPEMTFINVEPYVLDDKDGSLQPELDAQGYLVPNDATKAFKLVSEPIVFVVGSDGIIQSSFELIFTPDEIEAAILAVE